MVGICVCWFCIYLSLAVYLLRAPEPLPSWAIVLFEKDALGELIQYSPGERGVIDFWDDFGNTGADDVSLPDAINFPFSFFHDFELPVP